MRFLPTRVHGAIDYLWGLALMVSPWLAGMPKGGAAMWVAWFFGAGAIAYSLATEYEFGLVPIVPMPLHLGLDGVAGAVLAASPWLFGFAGESRWPHLAFGLFAVAASLVTKTRPARARGAV
ncbi:MAG: hypothetical protein JWR08_2670 [Enterovirga sp.]|nr:hypothetical protein [Enterovirga sp.]